MKYHLMILNHDIERIITDKSNFLCALTLTVTRAPLPFRNPVSAPAGTDMVGGHGGRYGERGDMGNYFINQRPCLIKLMFSSFKDKLLRFWAI